MTTVTCDIIYCTALENKMHLWGSFEKFWASTWRWHYSSKPFWYYNRTCFARYLWKCWGSKLFKRPSYYDKCYILVQMHYLESNVFHRNIENCGLIINVDIKRWKFINNEECFSYNLLLNSIEILDKVFLLINYLIVNFYVQKILFM